MESINEMSIADMKKKIKSMSDTQMDILIGLTRSSCVSEADTIIWRVFLQHLCERSTDKASAFRALRSEVAQAIAAQGSEENEPMQRLQTKMNRAEDVLNPVGELVGVEPENLTLRARREAPKPW